MWLFTGKTRTRVVPDGQTMRATCPACHQTTQFREIEVTTSGGVWFVDLVKGSERAWRCTGCGETFDLRDDAADDERPAAAALPAPTPPRDLLAELEAERAVRDAARARRDVQVDDELAALKRRLGK